MNKNQNKNNSREFQLSKTVVHCFSRKQREILLLIFGAGGRGGGWVGEG